MKTPDFVSATLPVISTFEKLGIDYCIGGSVASSIYGVARTTIDVDMITNLSDQHIDLFFDALRLQYYIDKEVIREAIQEKTSFNIIHLDTMLKIDVFILKQRQFDQQAFSRRKKEPIVPTEAVQLFVASAEDVILNKLEWYRLGRYVSERQWNDVIGILKVQGEHLDKKYLEKWAVQLGLSDLLKKATEQVIREKS